MSVERFVRELNGDFGIMWKRNAEHEIEITKEEFNNGEITIDDNGIARNCIGNILMDEKAYMVSLFNNQINLKATSDARSAEVRQFIHDYCTKKRSRSNEELSEMRSAFGEGTTVVDVLTGERVVV